MKLRTTLLLAGWLAAGVLPAADQFDPAERENLPPDACYADLDVLSWEADNIRFYQELREEEFCARAATCGMADYTDLRQPRLARLLGVGDDNEPPPVVAEIGGGFGRVGFYLFHHTTVPMIYMIERSHRYANVLRRRFQPLNIGVGYQRVRVLPFNLLDIPLVKHANEVVNVALWLWWGTSEVHPSRLRQNLDLVYRGLRKRGTFVAEVPVSPPIPTVVTRFEDRFMHLKMNDSPDAPTLHLHRVTKELLTDLATSIGFVNAGCEDYVAPSKPNESLRSLCYFEKR